ncbi:hypothetical protein K7432_007934 [Basidiobolus ranarum]|uniref:NADP-dependent oxidoreductase domain-containing protein n=1 Tax=Basidiobolus ranarum TaxID=34480 RepID=A0ABR2WSI9_9FUNG
MSNQLTISLSSTVTAPVIGFGTGTAWYTGKNDGPINSKLVDSIKEAVKIGYRHIDTAEIYGTEKEVGLAIEESNVPRDELFVTTKVITNISNPEKALRESLARLKLDYVDLYLIHSPFFNKESQGISLLEAWSAIENLVDLGLTRAIGVSNFRIQDFEILLPAARIKPVVNQIEFHPYLQSRELVSYTKKHGILTEAYGPLVSIVHKPGGPVDSVVETIAKKYSKTASQVLLRWSVHKGNIVVTTSSKPDRLAKFLQLNDFELTSEEVERIDTAGEQLEFRKFWIKEF